MQTNQPADLQSRIKQLERELAEIRKAVGLSSATIDRGGLTLLNDAFFRMVDDQGVEIAYLGPDSGGKQMVRLRREGGSTILYTYAAAGGVQYWALTDSESNIVMSDDAVSGRGLARPNLTIPTRVTRFDELPSTDSATFEAVKDTGFVYRQQPYWYVQAVVCSTDPGTSGEARFMLDGVQVGSTISVGFTLLFFDVGKFAVPGTHMSQHKLNLECRRLAGTGRIGADMVVRGEQS